jgi:regulator of sigma E protease
MVIIIAILAFGVLIAVHELGHFFAAKAFGVKVEEFALGMGPTIFKKQGKETLYSLHLLPFGGFCAMEGEDEEMDSPRAFTSQKAWKRVVILCAGAFMNFVAGLLILCIVFAPAQGFIAPQINSFEDYATVDDYGLQVGDRFVELDGEKILLQSDFSTILAMNPGDRHDLVVERDGELVYLDDFFMERHEVIHEDGIKSMMFGFSFKLEEATLGNRLRNVCYTAIDWIRTVGWSLRMIVNGQAGLSDMSGPVGIVQQMGAVADSSPTLLDAVLNMLYFGAFIAVNLAVMNLLPIPALDGGRVVSLLLTTLIEKITGKKLDPKYEGYIHGAGMILLLGLMAVIMFKDIIFIFK